MPAPNAGYQVSAGDPTWTAADFDRALERGVANFAKTAGITTQTGWDAFVAGLTAAQTTTVVKKILACVTCSVP